MKGFVFAILLNEGFSPMQPREITWSASRVFPPVRACMFSSHLSSVTFLADPSAGGGLPRGTFIYATSPLPVQVRKQDILAFASFFQIWEKKQVQLSDCLPTSGVSSGPIFLLGNRNCFLWRYWWRHWANSVLWVCYRSREARWGLD